MRIAPLSRPRAAALSVPVALAGSVALALGTTPAHAAEARAAGERMPRLSPAPASWSTAVAARSLPAQADAGTYVVRAGDTVSAIAADRGLRTADLLALNGLGWDSVIHPGQVLVLVGTAPAPAAASASHTVVAGDTVSAIAGAYGVTAQAVLDANGLGWSSIIYPGQTLALPGAGMLPAAASVPAPVPATGLDAEQSANARLIIRIGRELGVSERGIAIALGTAMQESWIRNLDGGDRDSLGLFQQRPSTGWGTAEQVRDPQHAIRAFYGGAADPNGALTRGLLDVPGWEAMSYADAAQAVQISAYPERYAQWEQPSYAWLAALG